MHAQIPAEVVQITSNAIRFPQNYAVTVPETWRGLFLF